MNFHEKPLIYTGEVHLNVTNLERSVQYYKEVIGFKVLEEKADKVVLTADGKKPLLIIEQPENITPKEHIALGFITSRCYCQKEQIWGQSFNILFNIMCVSGLRIIL